ncbi:MAG: NAD-dependent epimerase/dehydratase family protein [Phycisphaerae bacterium]|nr:NAD-dependent epimerase/dehydratase family protein [Phycisphaerae bacterium]
MGGSESTNPLGGFYGQRRVVVTGGAGFIGGHLVEALLLLGARVTVLDDLSNSDGSHVTMLAESYGGQLRFVYGSILDPVALGEAMVGSEVVFHLAAMNSVPRSIEEPDRTFEVNATGTVRVAEASRRSGTRRLVYAASSSAYGDDPVLPKVESMLPRPVSPYGASKLAGESVVRAWSRSYGVSGISLRLFNVFGPRQRGDDAYSAVVSAFISGLLSGTRPTIYGDGTQTRDFTPVANVVHAMLLAGALGSDPDGQVVNVALGRRTSVRWLFDAVARLVGREGVEPRMAPARRGDVEHSGADITVSEKLLGFKPIKGLEEGLAETVSWVMKQREEFDSPVAGGVTEV